MKFLELFTEIVTPSEVFDELTEMAFQTARLPSYHWIRVREVSDQTLVNSRLDRLDLGEAASIALAIKLEADALVIDEKKGRIKAKEYGIEITGLLGILKNAKSKGLIEKLQPILQELIVTAGFRIHPQLYEYILKSAGEHSIS